MKTCLHCAGAMPVYKGNRRNKYCSRRCARLAWYSNRPSPALIPCLGCGAVFKRHSLASKYCTRACQHALARKRYIEDLQNGKVPGGDWRGVSPHVKKWLRETYGNNCSICGWSEVNVTTKRVPLHVDHMDGNPVNHTLENLRLLCPNCHSLTPTFGNLNRGNGRRARTLKRQAAGDELVA